MVSTSLEAYAVGGQVGERRVALGQRLREARIGARLSQRRLGEIVRRTRWTIGKMEAAERNGDEAVWTAADKATGQGGALVAAWREVVAAEQTEAAQAAEAARAVAVARVDGEPPCSSPLVVSGGGGDGDRLALPGRVSAHGVVCPLASAAPIGARSPWPGGEVGGKVSPGVRGMVDAMDRREAVKLLLWTLVTLSGALDRDEKDRVSRALAQPSRVDRRTVEHVGALLAACQQDEDERGPYEVLRRGVVLCDAVEELLRDCPEAVRGHLLSEYAKACTSVAYYCLDVGDRGAAFEYCEEARAAAYQAGDAASSAHALCTLAYCAADADEPHKVRDAAAAARSLGAASRDPYLRACVLDTIATAHAMSGHYGRCMGACDRVDETLAAVGVEWAQSPRRWFGPGAAASKRTAYLLQLRRPEQAAASATRGLPLINPEFVGSRAFCLARLGQARLAAGDVDEAATVIGEAAGLAERHRSGRLTTALLSTRARMAPWQSTPRVTALDEQLSGYGFDLRAV